MLSSLWVLWGEERESLVQLREESGVDTQAIPGLLSSCDGSLCATLQLRVAVPEPSACQLVLYFEVSHLGH